MVSALPDTVFGMADVRVFHNPRCSKSRGALELLEARGVDYEVVRYLDEPPDADRLHEVISMLDEPAAALVRRDSHFRDLEIDPTRLDDVEGVVQLLVEHPRLLQRPVVIVR